MTQLLRFAAVFMLLAYGYLQAAVDPTDGTYRTTVTDMSVKVPGGSLDWTRSYERNAWHFAPAWSRLKFIYDDDDASVLRIDRAGDDYEKIAGDGTLFRFDDRLTITKTAEGWRWADRSGNWMDYAANGQPSSFGNRTGDTVTLQYDGDNLSTVTDRNGRAVYTLTWSGNELNQIADYSGREVLYAYETGLLRDVTDLRGFPWLYEYSNGKLSKLIDPLGRATALTLTPSGRTHTEVGPNGAVTRYEFEYLSGQKLYYFRTTRENGDKREVIETWTNRDREMVRRDLNGVTLNKIIRDGRNRILIDYRGYRTTYLYDEFSNLLGIEYPDGSRVKYEYDTSTSNLQTYTDERGHVTQHTYNSDGLLTKSVEAVGTAAERAISYAYNDLRRMISRTVEADSQTVESTSRYEYENGNVVKITGPEGETTFYLDFDSFGNARTTIDMRGESTIKTFDDFGALLSTRDPHGNTTTYEYDAIGNLVKTEHPPPSPGEPPTVVSYEYDSEDRRTATIDALGGRRTTEYDLVGNRISKTDESGSTLNFEYDAFNRMTSVRDGNQNITRFNYPDLSIALEHAGTIYQRVSVDYPTSKKEVRYDRRNREILSVLEYEDNLGTQRRSTETRYDLSGNRTEATFASGESTKSVYDERRRITGRTDRSGVVTTVEYDDRDNIVKVIYNESRMYRFAYDRSSRTKSANKPMGQVVEYSYDESNRLTTRIDERQQVARSYYDAMGRRVSVTYSASETATPNKTVSYSYDDRGRLIGYDDGTTSAEYELDSLGRKVGEAVNYGNFTWAYEYAYTASSKVRSYTSINGKRFAYSYDSIGNLTSISTPNEGVIALGDYVLNRPGTILYPGGLVRSMTYDGMSRLQTVSVLDQNSQMLTESRLSYDVDGNVSENQTEHGLYRYAYDLADRLTSADYPNGPDNDLVDGSFLLDTFPFEDDNYTYDANGNRSTDQRRSQESVWEYSGNGELLDTGVASYDYNSSGSRIRKRDPGTQDIVRNYSYDSEERLEAISDGAGNLLVNYYYDPFGRKLWNTVYPGGAGHSGGTEPEREYISYTNEGYAAVAGPVSESGIPSDQMITLTLFELGGQWSSAPILQVSTIGLLIFQNSAIGMPVGVWDSERNEWERRRTSAFGDTAGPEISRMRFPGQLSDPASSFYYNRYRDYDPETGQYVQSDPIGLGGGIGHFAYAGNNPINNVDVFGLFLSPVHKEITRDAIGGDTCFSGMDLPNQVANADFTPPDEAQKPENSYRHCMRNGLTNQTVAEAEALYEEYVENQISVCTVDGLAHALHATEDCAAGGHEGFQPWDGGVDGPFGMKVPTPEHIELDRNPDEAHYQNGVNRARDMLDRYKKRCPCTQTLVGCAY